MQFSDGDKVVGHYGTTYIRRNDKWYSSITDSEHSALSDATAEWLINLYVKPIVIEPKTGGKISKSDSQPVQGFIYKWTYVPLDTTAGRG